MGAAPTHPARNPVRLLGCIVLRRLHLLGVRVRVQARHQVEDVAERHRVQVLDERREEVVYVATAVFQLQRDEIATLSYLHAFCASFVFPSGSVQRCCASGCL